MTSSSTSGRSEPSSERAVVVRLSRPSSTSDITASAVNAFDPLAIPSRVSGVIGTPYPRCASPNARTSGGSPSRSTRTTPEKSVCAAAVVRASSRLVIPRP